MGKVILGMTMSLDGFINDRSGSVGALYPDLTAWRETEPKVTHVCKSLGEGSVTVQIIK